MMHRTRTSLAVAAMVVATALGGCGSKKDSTSTPTPAANGAAPTPDTSNIDPKALAWAKEFCGALSSQVKPITPPNMQSSTPADQQASLVAFFGTVVDQQAKQLDAFKTVGPPPGTAADTWKKSEAELKKVRKAIAKLTKDLKAEHPKSAKDLQDMVSGLKKQMLVLSKYQGPVADLQKDPKLGPALSAVPACATTR